MEPALTPKELAKRYPHLTPEQRIEMERWHRGRIHTLMQGLPVDESAQAPYREHAPGSLVDQAMELARTEQFNADVVIGLRRLHDQATDPEQQLIIGTLIESQIVMASTAEEIALIHQYWGTED
jgi:hypothetical protein